MLDNGFFLYFTLGTCVIFSEYFCPVEESGQGAQLVSMSIGGLSLGAARGHRSDLSHRAPSLQILCFGPKPAHMCKSSQICSGIIFYYGTIFQLF